ncbi:hypothetical protein DSCA_16470 [Desulfosarcina alkanivorans]|uniref:CMP/dCMP-type deaminase domain-containing protein n=1 Tax=Desulfosarcina alkanivorans TaxID=571177 RepID=A0A5K7YSU8_9BACT|nr:cytidine deaminase [Desulfosarcina alkanivorans]BBO67717.1 hypothetical protein DSCA_16470 [Desulfosarcina alkanivorans]
MNAIKTLINKCEIRLDTNEKTETFYKSLRELVTFLFSVIFGIGLYQLSEVDTKYETIVLFLAYISILLSWWGYHWGKVQGPEETNVLCYVVDCLLLGTYWYLINDRYPISNVFRNYFFMFLLYWAWEAIRYLKIELSEVERSKIKKAKITNFLFTLLMIYFLFIIYDKNIGTDNNVPKKILDGSTGEWFLILSQYFFIILYRFLIHKAYKTPKVSAPILEHQNKDDKRLIKEAIAASNNAKAYLSNFNVGAAILTRNGTIFRGCNIEFDNYSNTIHAEGSAISSMIINGGIDPVAIAVFTRSEKLAFSCGMCRQSLYEVGGPNLRVITCNELNCSIKTMEELLPEGFHL